MIQYITQHKMNYCIVHKVDRPAWNRADDVTIHLALKDAEVTLVSATENIDEALSWMLDQMMAEGAGSWLIWWLAGPGYRTSSAIFSKDTTPTRSR